MNKKVWIILTLNLILLVALVMLLLNSKEDADTEILTPVIAAAKVKKTAWRKINTIKLSSRTASALAVRDDGKFLVGDDSGINVYDSYGKKTASVSLSGGITALSSDKDIIYAALAKQIVKIKAGKLSRWPEFGSKSRITALAVSSGKLLVADAGKRKVYCYSADGKKLWEIKGSGEDNFIVPSPYFDLSPDGNGGIWVVNPGRHRIENYTSEGKFKALWEPLPANTMLGCCNPAYFGVLSGERFVTLEKGLVRSRLFAPSGKVIDNVVPENDFLPGAFKYDLAVLPGDRIVILDGSGAKINIYGRDKND